MGFPLCRTPLSGPTWGWGWVGLEDLDGAPTFFTKFRAHLIILSNPLINGPQVRQFYIKKKLKKPVKKKAIKRVF